MDQPSASDIRICQASYSALKVTLLVFCSYWIFEITCHIALYIRVNSRRKLSTRTILPSAVDIKHCILFFVLTIPYHMTAAQRMCRVFWLYMFPSKRPEVLHTDPVRCILESSLILFVKEVPELGADVFRLRVDNFCCVLYPGLRDISLLVEFNLRTKEVSKFKYHNLEIESTAEMLNVLIFTAALGSHVGAAHAFQDTHYANRHKAGSKYDKLFRHGPLLNEYAYYFTTIAHLPDNLSTSWFAQVLEHNSTAFRPPSHDEESLSRFERHSQYVRFAIPVRRILFRLVRIYNVNVDPELLFINSVIHSLDHYFMRTWANVYLEHKVLPRQSLRNLLRAMLFAPIYPRETFKTNYLADSKDDNEFYGALYKQFSEVDTELTKWITLSISA